MVVTFCQQYNVGEKPTVILYTTLIARQGHQKNSENEKYDEPGLHLNVLYWV